MKKTIEAVTTRKPGLWPQDNTGCLRRTRWPWLDWLWAVLVLLVMGQHAAAQAAGHGRAEAVFIKAKTSSASVYAGQALTVNYLLYHRVPLIEPDNEVNLTFKNCLVEEYPPLAKTLESEETIGGQVYQVLLIKKYLLIPRLAGTLQIPALAQHYSFNAPPSSDDFFEEQRLVSKTIRSTALQLLVRPLPVASDSVAFCNAVGQFQFQPRYTVSRRTDKLLSVRLQIKGSGSLKNFKLPEPSLPANVDVFNVRSEAQDTLTANGLQAIGTYSYDVLATYRGTYTLPGISLSYFDPVEGRYVSFAGPAFRWRVTQGSTQPPAVSSAALPASGSGRDLYTKNSLTEDQGNYLFLGSRSYYILLLLAGIFFSASLIYTYWANARLANRNHLNFRKAKRRASQAIRKLGGTPGADADAYYKGLAGILAAYLGDKLDLPPEAISYSNLTPLLVAAEVSAPLSKQTVAYLNLLHRLRFSASQPAAQPNGLYSEELLLLIQQLDACLHDNLSPQLVGAAA